MIPLNVVSICDHVVASATVAVRCVCQRCRGTGGLPLHKYLSLILLVHVREGLGGGAVGLHLPIFKSNCEHCPVPVSEDGGDGLTKQEAITNLLVVGLYEFRCSFAWSLTQYQALASERPRSSYTSLSCMCIPSMACNTGHSINWVYARPVHKLIQ